MPFIELAKDYKKRPTGAFAAGTAVSPSVFVTAAGAASAVVSAFASDFAAPESWI